MLIELATVESVLNIVKTVLGIGGLIFVHELGHFLVGRWCGVHAEAFSIGFGPVLLKWKGKPYFKDRPDQITEYRLSAIPLGGYVKFLGENPDERGERDPRSFHAASYPRKVVIMLAGVTMNLLAAFVLFLAVFSAGWRTIPPVVGEVRPGLPAWEHGVEKGEEIVSIDGKRVVDFMDVQQETIFAREVEVVLRKDGRTRTLRIPTRDLGEGVRVLGIDRPTLDDGTIVVEKGGAAAAAGFRSGDRVVAVEGTPVGTFEEGRKIHEEAKKAAAWTVSRDGANVELTLPWAETPHPRIGVVMLQDSDTLLVRAAGPAAQAGLRSGDRPVSVATVATTSATQFLGLLRDPARTGRAVVRRGGAEVVFELPAPERREEFAASIALGPGSDGIHVQVAPDGPAAAAQLPDGVEVLEVDGRAVKTAADIQNAVKAAFGESRAVVVKWRNVEGREGTTSVQPLDQPVADLGGMGAPYATREIGADGPVDAVVLAFDRTARWTSRIFLTLGAVFSGNISGSKLSGPVMIAKGTYASAESSWTDLFMFLGMISMNLAVLNVLPLPLLDGGQLAIHTIERIRGRAIPERVLEGVQWAGLVLLLALMVYVIRNDIVNL